MNQPVKTSPESLGNLHQNSGHVGSYSLKLRLSKSFFKICYCKMFEISTYYVIN